MMEHIGVLIFLQLKNLRWIVWIEIAFVIQQCHCQFSFSNQKAFHLTSDTRYPSHGDNITLQCRRKSVEARQETVGGFLGQDDNSVSWEENDLGVLTTRVDKDGGCIVITDARFINAATFGTERKRLTKTSCQYDGTTISLTIRDWTPTQLTGDRWKCLQFPFAESRSLDIQSFVQVTSVSIQQDIDRFNQPSRGTIVTCVTSPSRPDPHVNWFIERTDGTIVKITTQAEFKENVETDYNGLTVTTSSILFSEDDDHGLIVFCRTANRRKDTPVTSDELTVIVKYPPFIELHVDPGPSVLEETDVSLHCLATGRPIPTLKWIRMGDDSSVTEDEENKNRVISIDPTVFLETVTMKDSGEYLCTASNGLSPDVNDSVVLYVRELPPPADYDDQSTVDDSMTSGSKSRSNTDIGAVVGAVIAVLIVVIIITVVIVLYVRRKLSKQQDNFVGRHPRHSINSYADGHAIYTTCSSLPCNSELPPYVDVLPPAYRNDNNRKMSNITNPGYERVDGVLDCIQGITPRKTTKRPLPSTPPQDHEYGYDEINDAYEYFNEDCDSGSGARNTTATLSSEYDTTTNKNTTTRDITTTSNNNNNNNNNTNNTITNHPTNISRNYDNNKNITTIITTGRSDTRRKSELNASSNIDEENIHSSNNNHSNSNMNNRSTMQIRSFRLENGGYEVPVSSQMDE